jgi:heavy metal translocating P-type ATPase
LLESFAQARAQREMTALLARQPRTAMRHEDGRLVERPLGDIGPGDLLLVRSGEVVPVDGVPERHAATVDEAALTGESLPVSHAAGQPLMSGSTNVGSPFDLRVTRPAAQSTYAGIVRLVEAAQNSRPPMARLADRWALGFMALTAGLAGATWWFTHDAVRTLAVLVVATPCPLILAVPVALVAGMSRSARNSVLVKDGAALEAMARAKTLLIDKTGTLTGGVPRIRDIEVTDGIDSRDVLHLAASLAQSSPHVVSKALVEDALARGKTLSRAHQVREDHGAGVFGMVDGREVILGARDFVLAHVAPPEAASAAPDAPVPIGQSTVHVGVDGRLAGVIVMVDEPRAEAAAVLADLRKAGITRIVLVTGDRAAIARSVARQLPIDEIVADATPTAKVEVVRAESLRAPTVMVGDGVNDAPALAAAGVGIAMGARGATASAEAADAVILQDSLDRLPVALRIARRARAIALQSVAVGIALSTGGMVAAAAGYLSPLQGALLQELIDVAVILNALRALTAGPGENVVKPAS